MQKQGNRATGGTCLSLTKYVLLLLFSFFTTVDVAASAYHLGVTVQVTHNTPANWSSGWSRGVISLLLVDLIAT